MASRADLDIIFSYSLFFKGLNNRKVGFPNLGFSRYRSGYRSLGRFTSRYGFVFLPKWDGRGTDYFLTYDTANRLLPLSHRSRHGKSFIHDAKVRNIFEPCKFFVLNNAKDVV